MANGHPKGPDTKVAADLANWFTYHTPFPEQVPSYNAVREAGLKMAQEICLHAPSSTARDRAIEKIREAVMWASAAIACRGK